MPHTTPTELFRTCAATAEVCAIVMDRFVLFCQKSHGSIDMEMLNALITEFSGIPPCRVNTAPEQVKAKKAKSRKKATEECDFCRMPEPDQDKCMARSFGKGCGTQCTRKSKDSDYCGTHTKQLSEAGDPPLGRIDEPRRLMRADDDSKECGWKHFKNDGSGVEDTSAEAVGVGQVSPPMDNGESDNVDTLVAAPVEVDEVADNVDTLVTAPVEEDEESDLDVDVDIDAPGPLPAVEDSVPVKEDSVPAEKVSVPAEKVSVSAEKVSVSAEKVSVPVEEEVLSVPAISESETVMNSQQNEDSDTEDMTDDEEKEDHIRNGIYQGVEYVFSTGSDGLCTIKKFNKKTYQLKDVGMYDETEDEPEFAEYQSTHETHITDEDQTEVKWVE